MIQVPFFSVGMPESEPFFAVNPPLWRSLGMAVGLATLVVLCTTSGLFWGFRVQERTLAQKELSRASDVLQDRLNQAQKVLTFTSRRLSWVSKLPPGNIRMLLDDAPLQTPDVLFDIISVRWSAKSGIPELTSLEPQLEHPSRVLTLHAPVFTKTGAPKGRVSFEVALSHILEKFLPIAVENLVSAKPQQLPPMRQFIPLKFIPWGLEKRSSPKDTRIIFRRSTISLHG